MISDKNLMALQVLQAGVVQSLPQGALADKIASGKKLQVKLGVDPTAPDLHLGHAVVLEKLRQFQDLGYIVIFLIGDFTAKIGDPTGKSKTRPPLSDAEIASNTQTYFEQVGRILDLSKTQIRYNSEWLSKLSLAQILELAAKVTISQLIEREDFAKRLDSNQPVGFHELFYPILQGYDSVILQADVELGGTEQTFNLMMGRHLQQHFGQSEQVILTLPLLIGLDGVHKMSKSLNNTIGLIEAPETVYGKLMSISDDLMWHYYEVLLHYDVTEIKVAQALHPMEAKKRLAHAIVSKYWSAESADQAQVAFEKVFQQKDYSAAQVVQLANLPNPVWIVELLRYLNAASSSSEVRRLVEDGAVKIDSQVISDFKAQINWQSGMIIKVGKHRIYQIQ